MRIQDFVDNNRGGDIPDVNRTDLARYFFERGFSTGVEVGTETGVFAKCLLINNPILELHCVDPWIAYTGYRDHVSQTKMDSLFAEAALRLKNLNVVFHRKFSVDAAEEFEDGSVDFVYIDGNHSLKYVIEDLCAWVPKVRPGGIVCGHDYIRRSGNGYQVHVVEALKAYRDAYKIESPLYILGSKEAKAGEKRDKPRSWMWVK